MPTPVIKLRQVVPSPIPRVVGGTRASSHARLWLVLWLVLWLGFALSMGLATIAPLLGTIALIAFGIPFAGVAVTLGVRNVHTPLRKAPRDVELPASLGRDGLLLASGFVPVAELDSVQTRRGVCVITVIGGKRIELHGPPEEIARVKDLALSIAHESPVTRDARVERFVADFAGCSRSTLAADAFRGLATDPHRLLAISTDFRTAPRVRIAAAEMIADVLDEDMRDRMVDAATSSANLEVRAALLTTARRHDR